MARVLFWSSSREEPFPLSMRTVLLVSRASVREPFSKTELDSRSIGYI